MKRMRQNLVEFCNNILTGNEIELFILYITISYILF